MLDKEEESIVIAIRRRDMDRVVDHNTAALPSTMSVAREGALAGVIGAVALAFWFLIADSIAGQPFHTPALLGARVFTSNFDPADAGMPDSAAALVAGYTLVHGLAFVLAGLMIASAMAVFERTPPLLIPGFFFLFVFFEFVYYTYVLAFVEPVFTAVNWPAILIGNIIAVAAMAAFFLRRHPDLLRRLARG
ncbi:MAG: hypothetical protein JSU87_03620 [Gemmatimonadota bacterium]|nr:MAG: hypothetical protein JSU87_03620 [Gemmatimonadota bacterium]